MITQILLSALVLGPCDREAETISVAVAEAVACILATNNYFEPGEHPVYIDVPSFAQHFSGAALERHEIVSLTGGHRDASDWTLNCDARGCRAPGGGIRVRVLESTQVSAGHELLVGAELDRRPGRIRRTATICSVTMTVSVGRTAGGWRATDLALRQIC